MYRSVLNIIYTIFIVAGLSQHAVAQQGSAPVPVTITVTFDSPPTTYSVEQAPLKYNKDFALSMQIDDSNEEIYTIGFELFEGNESQPGMRFSDGCGNEHTFKISSSTFIFDNSGVDIHNGYIEKITWSQLDIIYNHGWGIINHGVNGDAGNATSFINYSIGRNRSYIRRKLYNSTEGGVITNVFVNPSGNTNWTNPAFNLGNISALRQGGVFPIGENGGDVNIPTIDWTQKLEINRYNAEARALLPIVSSMANSSVGGANYWCTVFSHDLSDKYYGDFNTDFTSIANTYGVDGLDNILMTTDEEIQDYLLVRDATNISTTLTGNSLEITFTGNVPNDLLFYSSTLLIDSDATISNILISGAEDYSDAILNTTDALINVNWDGYYVIPPEVLGDSMVTIASGTQTQFDCWIAMDYVITMTNGTHKDSLRQVLCDIPNVTYDDGFCNCETYLQQDIVTIAEGDCVTLIGPTGNYTYEWSVIDSTVVGTSKDHITCPTDTAQFALAATNPYGCPAEDTITVNIHYLNIDLGEDTVFVCKYDSIQLEGPSGMTTYEWSDAEEIVGISPSVKVSPINSTEYYLNVTDSYGSSAEDSVLVDVRLIPTSTIQPEDTTIVLGDTITLTGPINTNYSYNWKIGDSMLGSDSISVTVSPTNTIQYNLIVEDSYGCIDEDSTLVNVHSLSISLIQDTVFVCEGDSVELVGPPYMAVYDWNIDNSTIDTIQNIYVDPITQSNYYLNVKDTIGATAVDSILVTVGMLPQGTILSNDTIIDIGECTTLQGKPGFSSYAWSDEDSIFCTSQDTLVCPTDSITYNLIATNESGCQGNDNVTVSVDFVVVDLGSDTSICEGNCVYLEGLPDMVTYLWYENGVYYSSDQSIEPCPTDTTEYSLLVIDQFGTSDRDTIQINVWPLPTVDLGPSDTTILLGDTYFLIGATDAIVWEWYKENTVFSIAQDTFDIPNDTVQYNQIATNIYGCVAEDSIMVNVHSFNFTLGPDTTICEGSCIPLAGPPDMREYYWYVADTIYDSINQVIQPCPIDITQYILVVEDTIGAQATDTIIVNLRLNPPVYIQPIDSTINYGDCIDLYGPDTNFIYQWSIGDSILIDSLYTITTCPLDTTLYKLIVTDTFGCSSEDSTHVYLNFLSFSLGNDTIICEGSCILIDGPPDMVQYEWYVADTVFATTQSIEPCPEDSTIYSLWVENDIGATAQDSITISLKPTPSVSFEVDTIQACAGDSVVISVVASEDVDFYTWYYLGEDSTTTINTITLKDVSFGISNFYVVVESENGCTNISTVELNILGYPEIEVTADTAVCQGDSVELSIIGGNYFYWISNDDTISTESSVYVKPIEQTDYIAQSAIDSLMCYAVDTITVQVYEPALTKIIYDTNFICTYESVILEAEGAENYIWMPGGDTTEIYSFVITDTAKVWLTGVSLDGCSTVDSAVFYTRYAPEVSFTGLLPAFCLSDAPVNLVGSPAGGEFIGLGNDDGIFDPAVADTGVHEIIYSYQPHPDSCFGYDTIYTVVYGNDGEIDLGPDFSIELYDTKELDAGEGFDSYYWNNGETSQTIEIYGTDKPPHGTYEYAVIGVINSCSTKGGVFVTFLGADGYSDEQIQNLVVYPNPSTGKFSVMFSSTEKDILLQVTTLQGNLLYKKESIVCDENCTAKVDLEGVTPGFYILQLITPKGISTTKIILK